MPVPAPRSAPRRTAREESARVTSQDPARGVAAGQAACWGGLWEWRVCPSGAVAVRVPSGWRVMAPAPAVDRDLVVEPAEQDQVAQAGGAAVGPVDQVVHLADRRGLPAPGELAMLVAEDDGGAQVGRDGAGGAADVERLAGGVEGGVEQGAAQVGGHPAGAGDDVQAPAQEGGLQPLPGACQAAGSRGMAWPPPRAWLSPGSWLPWPSSWPGRPRVWPSPWLLPGAWPWSWRPSPSPGRSPLAWLSPGSWPWPWRPASPGASPQAGQPWPGACPWRPPQAWLSPGFWLSRWAGPPRWSGLSGESWPAPGSWPW